MKVEMRTSTHESGNGFDSLYLYTIFDDDNGNRYERVPERFLKKRDWFPFAGLQDVTLYSNGPFGTQLSIFYSFYDDIFE